MAFQASLANLPVSVTTRLHFLPADILKSITELGSEIWPSVSDILSTLLKALCHRRLERSRIASRKGIEQTAKRQEILRLHKCLDTVSMRALREAVQRPQSIPTLRSIGIHSISPAAPVPSDQCRLKKHTYTSQRNIESIFYDWNLCVAIPSKVRLRPSMP